MKASNVKAMRDALGIVLRYLQWLYAQGCTDRGRLSDEIDRVVSAIDKPPRNCDVGSADEQIKRWEKFCQEHHEYWRPDKSLTAIQKCNCPCHEGNGCNYFVWAQMPYTEGGGE